MSTHQFKTDGLGIERNNHSDMQKRSSISLLSCFLDVLSLFFSPLNDDNDHHLLVIPEDTHTDEEGGVSSNIIAQKHFRQLHQIKGQ
ncbi:hypothetical protein L6452_09991 [Arctium lappa]|uniref:Uncharacterized protein n=1 Tax=Arctium lappa TaxID=4217 RepID=A0ACB9DLW0_ARCLA|nr:hypothetical protein L6452_09991 [Arctium lappa]